MANKKKIKDITVIEKKILKTNPRMSEIEACIQDKEGIYFDSHGLKRHNDYTFDNQGIRRHKNWKPLY
jgi:hypothetical protein